MLLQRAQFEKARNAWHTWYGNWIAIDFEEWEMDHTVVTEVGISIVQNDIKSSKSEGSEKLPGVTTTTRHLIVKDNMGYQNGVFSPAHRDVSHIQKSYDLSSDYHQRFAFGNSEIVTLKEIREELERLFTLHSTQSPLFLIFHGGNDDIRYVFVGILVPQS